MAGLDTNSRAEVSHLLGRLNEDAIRVVLVQRSKGEPLPPWVTDIVEIKGGDVWIGKRDEWEPSVDTVAHIDEVNDEPGLTPSDPVVKLQDVSVSYGEGSRPVLKSVSWEILPGSRWHLQGANGEPYLPSH